MAAITKKSALTAVMDAAILDNFGDVNELVIRQIPVPDVGEDDVLISVISAGVASWDAFEREGKFEDGFRSASRFPYVLGWDGAGTVAAIGRNVRNFSIGDRVYAATKPVPRGGFYAEYTVVRADHVAHIPDKLAIEQAGAMAWDALTALSGLENLKLKQCETLMIFGASGGIGHLALQLAQHRGVRVLAVASGEDGVKLAQELGAGLVVDGHREDVAAAVQDFAPKGLDAALVTVGGHAAENAISKVRDTGRIAIPNGVLPLPKTASKAAILLYDGSRSRTATDKLNALIEAGPYRVHLADRYELENVQDAHQRLKTHFMGKLVLNIASTD